MKFLEKDLEKIIHESSEDKLFEKGLNLQGKKFRQKKIGNYGIADLICFERPFYHTYFNKHMKGQIQIVELKQDKITVSAFFQAIGYLKGIQRFLDVKHPNIADCFNFNIVLIGKTIDKSSTLIYLNDIFFYPIDELTITEQSRISVSLYTYDYTIDGLMFNELTGYNLKNENF